MHIRGLYMYSGILSLMKIRFKIQSSLLNLLNLRILRIFCISEF